MKQQVWGETMYTKINDGSVTSAKGFTAQGIHCGIKKSNKDLALIYSEQPCVAAGVFTLNKAQAAPVVISKKIVDAQSTVKAILVNSGVANACTGEDGFNDAIELQSFCAEQLGVNTDEVLVSSTGVIGKRIPKEKMKNGIEKIVKQLQIEGGSNAAEAIMTTDTKKKSFAYKVDLSGGAITIGAICKGSGMIMPNMATMLAFITTDAMIEKKLIQKMLTDATNISFNKISVDGETSTNDMVILLSNGLSGIKVFENSDDYQTLQHALNDICVEMAKSIVWDGEGATKLITINVTGAHSKVDADLVGKTIANSPLVKTAIYGQDANWGRILSAAGMSGADIDPTKMSIKFNDLSILEPNYNITLDEEKASQVLSLREISLNINLNGGSYSSTWWTCDFSEQYVKINAHYRT